MLSVNVIDIGLDGNLAVEQFWRPLDRNKLLCHFKECLRQTRVDWYIREDKSLLPNEKVILFWLVKVYGDSLATIDLYARYSVQFLNFVRQDFNQVSHMDVDAFLRSLTLQGVRPSTLATVAAALKSFYRTMVDAHFMVHNPTAFVRPPRTHRSKIVPGHLKHSFTEAEMRKLMLFMEERAPVRDRALFKVLYMTGLRAIEVCTLKWRDLVEWQSGWYFEVLGKGSKERRVYVPSAALDLLMAYRYSEFGVSPYKPAPGLNDLPIFSNHRRARGHLSRHAVYKVVKKWVKCGLGKDASPHWMRHTCFTLQRLKGATLEAIQLGAGHSSIETTMKYNEAAALMNAASKVFEN